MKVNKRISALLVAAAMTITSGAFVSSADAAVCGGWTTTKHTSSWASRTGWFKSHACLNASSTTVSNASETSFEGDLGVNTYQSVSTLKDLTNGATRTYVSDPYHWGENSTNSAVRRFYPTGSLPRIAGHKYAVWTWDAVDVMNDGKGTFNDQQSFVSWTAPKA